MNPNKKNERFAWTTTIVGGWMVGGFYPGPSANLRTHGHLLCGIRKLDTYCFQNLPAIFQSVLYANVLLVHQHGTGSFYTAMLSCTSWLNPIIL